MTDEQSRLITDNIKLAYHLAFVSPYKIIEFDDRVQIASMALMRAARYYKPELGKFGTFAGECVKYAILNAYKKAKKSVICFSLDAIVGYAGNAFDDYKHLEDVLMEKCGLEYRHEVDERISAQDIQTVVDDLPWDERQIIQALIAGSTQQEIADTRVVSKQCINQKLAKVRRKISKQIGTDKEAI